MKFWFSFEQPDIHQIIEQMDVQTCLMPGPGRSSEVLKSMPPCIDREGKVLLSK